MNCIRFDAILSVFILQALVLKPQTASTYTAIGFVHALMGKLEKAVEYLHRSLAIKRDDIFTSGLLKYCMEDLMEENELPENIANAQTDVLSMIQSPKLPDKPTTSVTLNESEMIDPKEMPIFNASEKMEDVSMEM